MLIKRGVELDITDSFGMTALHYAAYNKCDVLVQEVLRSAGTEAGDLANIFDHFGRTASVSLFWNTTMNEQGREHHIKSFKIIRKITSNLL
jgi:ankyrin repeat protein